MGFSLHTFGGLRLLDPSGRQVAFPEKGMLILAYLLTCQNYGSDRQTLARFLWGDDDDAVSLSTLRKTVSRIRQRQEELGTSFLSFSKHLIYVDPGSLSLDDLAFEKDEPAEPFLRLIHLCELLSRPFLGAVTCESRRYYEWLANRQGVHTALLRDAMEAAFRIARTPSEYEIVKDAALLLFRAEPYDPDTLQLLLKVFNAEREVEEFRQFIEKRRAAISRGVDTLNLAADNGSDEAGAREMSRAYGPGVQDAQPAAEPVGAPKTRFPKLVLLPPRNQSSSLEAGLMAASLIEDITIGFCAFNSLQVIAPHSAIRIGHYQEDKASFFENNSVTYVLDTRISNIGGEVTLFAQLVFVPDNEITWAARFGLGQVDLVRDRRTLSRRVALSVSNEIERHETTRAFLELNPVAYHRYLVGKQHLSRLTLPNLRLAREQMEAVLETSPHFAPALSAVARTYSKEWLLTARGNTELLKAAETSAARAVKASGDLADGYREFGVAKLLQGAFDESAGAMELAEILGPHYADVIADHADTMVHCSRPAIALEKIERAIELNPISPDAYLWTAAGANYALSKFEDSLDYIGKMADPSLADRLSAANWAMLDQLDRAQFFVRRVRETNPAFDVDQWLAAVPSKEQWHKDLYREGLKKAGF
ncbi:hypothetical protein ACQKGL_03250 [Ensifer adhaerens]|uniref:hypothetical protein n=1 Tax=Ensifer adhaerens TaxID=106592 RepID=UPI003D03C52A